MKPALVCLGLLLLAPGSWGLTLWDVDIPWVEIESSYWSIVNSVGDSAPSPLVNTLGVSVPIHFKDRWFFRPEVQVFFSDYAYQGGRAVPEDSMFPNVSVLSLMTNATLGYEYPINHTLSWFSEGGLALLLRAPVFVNGGATAGAMVGPTLGWFYLGNFIYPDIGSSITWQFSSTYAATFRAQLFYPLFDLWSGQPWYDELTYGVGVGIRITL